MESIKRILAERSISLSELARRSGTRYPVIHRAFSGRRGFGVVLLKRIAYALNVSVGYLLGETDTFPPRILSIARNIQTLHPDTIDKVEMIVREYQVLQITTQRRR